MSFSFEKLQVHGEKSFHMFRAMEDTLYDTLEPVLTDEQNQRLKEYRERHKRGRDKRSKNEK